MLTNDWAVFYTVVLSSTDMEWLWSLIKNLHLGKYRQPFWATLRWLLNIALCIPTAHDFRMYTMSTCTYTTSEISLKLSLKTKFSVKWARWPFLVKKIILLKVKNWEKNCVEGKTDIANWVHKSVTWGCKLWTRKLWLEGCFESVSFRIVWFCSSIVF